MILITGESGFLGQALSYYIRKTLWRKARDEGGDTGSIGVIPFDLPSNTIIWPDPYNQIFGRPENFNGLENLSD
ncbi:MAG: hypothetical protein V3W19_00400, partial [Desulfatiglandales bacterium]